MRRCLCAMVLFVAGLALGEHSPDAAKERPISASGKASPSASVLSEVADIRLNIDNFRSCKTGAERTNETDPDQETSSVNRTVDLNSIAVTLASLLAGHPPGSTFEQYRTALDNALRQRFQQAVNAEKAILPSVEQATATVEYYVREATAHLKHLPLGETTFSSPILRLQRALSIRYSQVPSIRKELDRRSAVLKQIDSRQQRDNASLNSLNAKLAMAPPIQSYSLFQQKLALEARIAADSDLESSDGEEWKAIMDAPLSRERLDAVLSLLPKAAVPDTLRWRREHLPALVTLWESRAEQNRAVDFRTRRFEQRDQAAVTLAQQLFAREILVTVTHHPNLRPVLIFQADGTIFHAGFYEFEGAATLPPVVRIDLPAGTNLDQLSQGRDMHRHIARHGIAERATFARFLNCPPLLSPSDQRARAANEIDRAITAQAQASRNGP